MNQRFTFAFAANALDRFSVAWKAFDRFCGDPVRPIPTLTVRSSVRDGTKAILAYGPYRFATPKEVRPAVRPVFPSHSIPISAEGPTPWQRATSLPFPTTSSH